MQKAFLSGVTDLYKGRVGSDETQKGEVRESELSNFWKNVLSIAGRESKIEEINKVIGDFQSAIEEYKHKSSIGTYGKVSQFNMRLLSLIDAIPDGRDEFGLITNLILIVFMAFRMHCQAQGVGNTESEKIKLLQIINSVLGSFLVLQKREFNIAIEAFMQHISINESGKQIFPIEFIGTDIENPKWKFTQGFKDSTQSLMNTDRYTNFGYTDMATSCPAATNGLLPLLTRNIFNILYENPQVENKDSTI